MLFIPLKDSLWICHCQRPGGFNGYTVSRSMQHSLLYIVVLRCAPHSLWHTGNLCLLFS